MYYYKDKEENIFSYQEEQTLNDKQEISFDEVLQTPSLKQKKDFLKQQIIINEAKAYLANTDYKMLPNYVPKVNEDLDAIIAKRNETREFIRNNNA